jgi:hypothetical protein
MRALTNDEESMYVRYVQRQGHKYLLKFTVLVKFFIEGKKYDIIVGHRPC